MNIQYTKGPWVVGKAKDAIINPDLHNDGLYANECDEYYGGKVICESVSEENRPILCAVPDMLESIELIVELIETKMYAPNFEVALNTWVKEFARPIMAKAKGE